MIYLIFIFGLILGSFYLVLGTRLPIKESIMLSRSKCDHCKNTLNWYNLIPLLSYIFQLGKCTKCKKKISILYPMVELGTGALFAYLYYIYGFGYEFYLGIVLASLFIIIAITDFKYYIILDSTVIIGAILISVLHLIYSGLYDFISYLLSGLILFGLMYLIMKIGNFIFKKESLGGGDIKFAFIIGLTVGLHLSLFVLVISAFVALPTAVAALLATKNKEVAYGPFLAGALFLVYLNIDKFISLIDYINV